MKKLLLSIAAVVSLSACISNPNTLTLGSLGGLGGGYLGSMVGKGNGRVAAATAGALLGAAGGGYVGGSFDRVNENGKSINALSDRLNRLNASIPSAAPSPIVYPYSAPVFAPSNSAYSVPVSCVVVNNYLRCNGR